MFELRLNQAAIKAVVVLGAALLTGGCHATDSADGGLASDKASRIEKQRGTLPARYGAPLPGNVAELRRWLQGGEAAAPVAHVRDSLLAGEPEWFARLKDAAGRVPAKEVPAWASLWDGVVAYHSALPAFCAEARPIMQAEPSALRVTLAGAFARSCAKVDDTGLVLREDSPAKAVVDYYERAAEQGWPVTFNERLEAVVTRIAIGGDDFLARRAAFVLADMNSPEATAALLRVHGQIVDRRVADEVAMAFFRTDSAEGLARAKAACARDKDPMCDHQPSPTAVGEMPSTTDERKVRATIERLQKLGFDRVGALNVKDVESEDAGQLLVEAGHAFWFDVETGRFPNEHDALLRSLAALVTPLHGVVFEEHAPLNDEGPYELVAYSDSWIYRLPAENLGDWYDVDAVLRLLNTLLEDKGASERFAPLATNDQSIVVVGARRQAIEAAFAQGVLESAEAGAAEKTGKAFEAEVLNAIEDQAPGSH
jgi:hypothetical protein